MIEKKLFLMGQLIVHRSPPLLNTEEELTLVTQLYGTHSVFYGAVASVRR